MKKYRVSLSLIIRYDDEGEPVCRLEHYDVEAESEKYAIEKAKKLETSLYSIDDEYADEIEDD